MRADEGVFRVIDGVIFYGKIAQSDSEFEIQLMSSAFEAVKRQMGDDGEGMSEFWLFIDSSIEETQADGGVVGLRLP